jgi:hypothetical protein
MEEFMLEGNIAEAMMNPLTPEGREIARKLLKHFSGSAQEYLSMLAVQRFVRKDNLIEMQKALSSIYITDQITIAFDWSMVQKYNHEVIERLAAAAPELEERRERAPYFARMEV